jgi:3-hydroxyisobutyrate dehydrogenase
MSVGFIGLGVMGEPMARNLLRGGFPLIVWNRSRSKCAALQKLGATVADTAEALFDSTHVVLLMLLNEQAIDSVLDRGSAKFQSRLRGKILVNLGTTSPGYSQQLARDIRDCGGCYVESPVSGSRQPAEQGRLIGMLAGDHAAVDEVAPLLAPLCSEVFRCGEVPNALRMKLAVNHYLIATVTALAETVHAARAAQIDLHLLQRILDAGPMASTVSRIKLAKLVNEDHTPQAAIRDVRTIARLVAEQCADAGAATPIIDLCAAAYRHADEAGLGDLDMAAVGRVLGRS